MSRLPIPGSDNGVWGDVLNDFLTVEHNADGTLKKAALITGAEQTANKGNANGYASLNGSTKVPITQVPTGSTSTTVSLGNHTHAITALTGYNNFYPLAEYGYFSVSTPVETCGGNSTMGNLFFARLLVPAGKAINTVATVVTSAGTLGGGGDNCFAVYDDAGTLAGRTASDNALWSVGGWRPANLTSPIVAQASDRFVYVTAYVNGYSGQPSQCYNVVAAQELYSGPLRRRSFYGGAGSLPASIDVTSFGSNTGYLPFYAIG